ncbi:sigma-54 interaction domain-containing protein [Pseudalkalibacillus hwajinpoensis]|uniref:sigma-54 interaction domain-containing protein n=1 Tax=Guptibacillus hwajinpoensis TaxID=208199 RepID=UPI001CD68DF6|nr:sigma-54-dependent Fis family transcriptional regulator [Pseudalkalibacillus hwajinpoensis]MCA0990977.1 sigma-54-dependent Fis family transcriptional regulator [Pseudalkalibacillus hwajinpoensis]
MKKLRTCMIVGAGRGGLALLQILQETKMMKVIAMVDCYQGAPGILKARNSGIAVFEDWKVALNQFEIDVIVEATGDEAVFEEIRDRREKHTVLIPGSVANIVLKLIEEKEILIDTLRDQSKQQEIILDSTHDGMIAVNVHEEVTLFNRSAEKITGISKELADGKIIGSLMASSRLPRVLSSGKAEINKEQLLPNGKKIITTRIPMFNDEGKRIGALAVFKDMTAIEQMAQEVTNLKSVQSMLEAIIQSSDEAISVVDETGKGLMINPAYTRLTGLQREEVIGKPANTDISEGESMHMRVLRTRKPVRGVQMKVGPAKREVVVNVSPVIVDGLLKGSVGVIHDISELHSLNNQLQRARQIIRTLEAKYSFEDIIGKSEEMTFSVQQAKLAASTPATVLLRGESGTGKELFAHAIHNASDRKYNKFVRVNCAAISESLFESELFGYEDGAFSGARQGGKRGLFEEANGGSIFLDEIGEVSLGTQAKLLRVLQEREIVRVGGAKPISINVRIIAATNAKLEKRIIDGSFREDLYYRLNRLPIQIAPLRQRKEDITALAKHLLTKINQDYGRNVKGITDGAVDYLKSYDWPGNVREFENVLGRIVIHMDVSETMIDSHHLPSLLSEKKDADVLFVERTPDKMLSQLVDEFEKKTIRQTLAHYEGNKTATAKALGVSLRNLYYKMEKHGIEKSGMQ